MADDSRRDELGRDIPHTHQEPGRVTGSPLGTDPQEAAPLPGDPREAQEPQEPRTSHIGTPGREGTPHHEETARPIETAGQDRDPTGDEREEGDRGVAEQLKEVWDRMRGKE